jgi:hypothetical protein
MITISKSPHHSRNTDHIIERRECDLEYDLRTTDWILKLVHEDAVYAQNLYAALCNNSFKKLITDDTPENILNVLKGNIKPWSCSWRYAGGIIADMRQQGDYMDYYCSGIVDDVNDVTSVPEGTVILQIRDHLKKLGWTVLEDDSN